MSVNVYINLYLSYIDPIKTQLRYLLEANITLIQKKGSDDLEAATP